MALVHPQGPQTFTVTVHCPESGDHLPVVLSARQGDLLLWQTADGSTLNVRDIRKATQADVNAGKLAAADLFINPNAPTNPFPQPVPMLNAQGKIWGPAARAAAGQTYKYTLEACGTTFDPHIIVGP